MKAPPPPRFRLRGFTLQLFLFAFLPLSVLLLAVTFGSLALHQNAMRELVGERDERAVRMGAGALEEAIRLRAEALRGLDGRGEPSARLAHAAFLQGHFDAGYALLDAQGALLAANGEGGAWRELAGLAGEALPLPEDGLLLLTVRRPSSQETALLIVAGLPESGQLAAGALSIATLLDRMLGEAFLGAHPAAVMVVDAGGDLLYQSGALMHDGPPGAHLGVTEALRGETGVTYLEAADGEHVAAYSPVTPPGWAMVVEEPWEMVSTPTLRATQFAPLILAPVVLLALAALWLGARQVVQPLQTLEERASALAWGDFAAITQPVGGIHEIRRLQSELIHLAQKVQAAQQGLRGYIGAMTAAQEEERRRLARELHDDTIQALIALKQRIQLAQMAQRSESEDVALSELVTLTEQTIENLRRLTRALSPNYLEDLGLVTALEMLAREAGAGMGVQVEFQRRGVERRLPSAVELALYRMAQEALNNIARHAQAGRAWLHFTFTENEAALEIGDDGLGFSVPKSPAEFAPGGHFGLLGLYERAELIGAKLNIESAAGQGTRLTVTVPLVPP